MELKGKRSVVLGGTSGIGLAVTRQLVAAGADVVAGSHSEERVAEAARALPAADFRQVDVLDRSGLASLFAGLAPIDILVNAATGGARAVGPFVEMDLDGFQGSFQKLWGYVNSVRLCAEHLSETAAIVLVSGFPARKCTTGMSAISTVGNAVEGFVRAIAPEIAPRRINVVSPGVIDTPMISIPADQREAFFAQATAQQPVPRAGTADEVADAVLFFLKNDFTTGATLDIEGGALLP